MKNAIMEFGKMLSRAKNFTTTGQGPIFAWAAPGDVVILGEAPEDFDGRVCSVKLPDEEKPLLSRLYRDGEKVLVGYMDDFDVWKSYPLDDVTILAEVLGVIHQYGLKDRPKASDTWEKRTAKAIKGAVHKFSYRDYDRLCSGHKSGHNYDTFAAAFCIGYQAGKKDGEAK